MGDVREFSVELTDGAMGDLRAIKAYIGETLLEPLAARRIATGILSTADALSVMPMRNRVLLETSDGLEVRSARSASYTLCYLVCDDVVRVFAVLYSASDVTGRLERLLER